MRKIFESYFKNRLSVNFVRASRIDHCLKSDQWQILLIGNWKDYWNCDYPYCSFLNQINYQKDYINQLSLNKKILILGNWRQMVGYYRFLRNKKYRCYLIKS